MLVIVSRINDDLYTDSLKQRNIVCFGPLFNVSVSYKFIGGQIRDENISSGKHNQKTWYNKHNVCWILHLQ